MTPSTPFAGAAIVPWLTSDPARSMPVPDTSMLPPGAGFEDPAREGPPRDTVPAGPGPRGPQALALDGIRRAVRSQPLVALGAALALGAWFARIRR